MGLGDFVRKQFVDVIEWTEPEDGILSFRFPMRDREIQNGAMLTVRESQAAAFVNEGRIADVFGPGVHRLTTRNLPLLTDLMNWDKLFESPFKSDVYFFSKRLQVDQRWGTATPVTVRDAEFGAISLRAYGVYTYRVADPRTFHSNVSGTRDVYRTADLDGQLRAAIVGAVSETFATSRIPFVDMAANQAALGAAVGGRLGAQFSALGLRLESFIVQNLSVPDELQERLNERIGMAIAGDLDRYTKFQAAKSLATAAAAEGGAAGAGVGLGAGLEIGQTLAAAVKADDRATKACIGCGKSIPAAAKFCPDCGKAQG